MNDNRIAKSRNRITYGQGFGIGRNNPIALHTSPSSVYRLTGVSQIADIINCGYVRSRKGTVKGGHTMEVFWAGGGKDQFYYDKTPVLETPADKVTDGQIGALPLEELSAIWIFDYNQNCYSDKKDFICQLRKVVQKNMITVSTEQVNQLLDQHTDAKISIEELKQLKEFINQIENEQISFSDEKKR